MHFIDGFEQSDTISPREALPNFGFVTHSPYRYPLTENDGAAPRIILLAALSVLRLEIYHYKNVYLASTDDFLTMI